MRKDRKTLSRKVIDSEFGHKFPYYDFSSKEKQSCHLKWYSVVNQESALAKELIPDVLSGAVKRKHTKILPEGKKNH